MRQNCFEIHELGMSGIRNESSVEDVEDVHPQHVHYRPHREDSILEVDIFRMLVPSPKTQVIDKDS
jgi:hypothetical protein